MIAAKAKNTTNPDKYSKYSFAHVTITAIFTFLVINYTGQFQQSFHNHDDWLFLLPNAAERYLWFAKTEGRWINYLWSFFSFRLSPEISFAIVIIIYGLSILIITSKIVSYKIFPLAYIALFFSPIVGVNFGWSIAQLPATTVLLMTVFALSRAPSQQMALVAAFVGQIAAYMTYPAVAPVIFLTLIYFWPPLKCLKVAIYVFCFGAALLTSTILMSVINYVISGHFGIEISSWRCPNPGISAAAIGENFVRFSVNAVASAKQYIEIILLGLATLAIGLIDRSIRPFAAIIGIAAGIILLTELALTLYTGTVTPNRARYWIWFAPMLICIVAVQKSEKKLLRYLFTVVVTIFAIVGVSHWIQLYTERNYVINYHNSLIERAIQMQRRGQHSDIYIYSGDTVVTPNTSIEFTFWGFKDYAWLKYGIILKPCEGQICEQINNSDLSHGPVFVIQNRVSFRFEESSGSNPREGFGCI